MWFGTGETGSSGVWTELVFKVTVFITHECFKFFLRLFESACSNFYGSGKNSSGCIYDYLDFLFDATNKKTREKACYGGIY